MPDKIEYFTTCKYHFWVILFWNGIHDKWNILDHLSNNINTCHRWSILEISPFVRFVIAIVGWRCYQTSNVCQSGTGRNSSWLGLSFFSVAHHSDVIMGAMASQITGVSIVYSTVCSAADQRKHQSFASLAFVRGIHRWTVNSPHKRPVTENISILVTLSCDRVLLGHVVMIGLWSIVLVPAYDKQAQSYNTALKVIYYYIMSHFIILGYPNNQFTHICHDCCIVTSTIA